MIYKRLFFTRLAILNTFKKKFRASLAIGGIALSSSIMIILFGVGLGLQSLVTEQVEMAGSKDVITVNQRNIQSIKLNDERIATIQSISGVSRIEELVGLVGTLTYHGIDLNIPVYAVTEGYFTLSPQEELVGETVAYSDATSIVLSSKALQSFGIDPANAKNKTLMVSFDIPNDYSSTQSNEKKTTKPQTYAISAAINRGEQPVAYISLEEARKSGIDSVSQLKIQVTSPDKLPSVRESIEQMGLQTTNVQDSVDEINRIFDVIQRILLVFGIIAFVITVFGTFNVITLTLIEQTQQIGFLRLMGMQRQEVGFLFIAQSIMLTMSGVSIGIIAGCFGGFAINGIAQALAGNTVFSESVYIFKIPYLQIIIMVMLSVVLGWLIGKIPARRAVVIGPLEELHG
jgi:ABC-type antimicrobial peptide transport system permease subunit